MKTAATNDLDTNGSDRRDGDNYGGDSSSSTNTTTTTTTGNHGVLDFRDIRRHPPPALFTPLPPDPKWDAHRVLFNERPRPPRIRGDEFDAVFEHEAPEIEFEKCVANKQSRHGKGDERAKEEGNKQPSVGSNRDGDYHHPDDVDGDVLDPLGWPVVPEVFRTTTTTGITTAENGTANQINTTETSTWVLSNIVCTDDDVDEDADHDDLNLLKRTSDAYMRNDEAYDDDVFEEDDDALIALDENNDDATTAQVITGVELAYQPSSSPSSATATTAAATTLLGYRVQQRECDGNISPQKSLSKEARIRQYETIGVDEESSVEEEEDDDGSNCSGAEGNERYYQAKDDDDDDDEIEGNMSTNFASFDTDCHHPVMQQQVAQLQISHQTNTTTTTLTQQQHQQQQRQQQQPGGVQQLPSSPSTTSFSRTDASKKKKKSLTSKKIGTTTTTTTTTTRTAGIPLLRPPPSEKLAAWEASKTNKK